MTKIFKTLSLATLLIAVSATASAQVVVVGNGLSHNCYRKAVMGDQGSKSAIKICSEALDDYLSKRDRAATHVNRGVLLMRSGKYEASKVDYEKAIQLRPKLDQAYINYGASLLYLGEHDAALTALNAAIDMDTEKMAEALYNRSLVYDAQSNHKLAYYDLKSALKIRPDWAPALSAIDRYVVTTKAKM